MGIIKCICLSALVAIAYAAPPVQVPLQEPVFEAKDVDDLEHAVKTRPLHGRFLHITGIPADVTQ